jgi:hypothetical protein
LNAEEKEMQHASSLRWCRRFLEFVASALGGHCGGAADFLPQAQRVAVFDETIFPAH